jgi:hypothetical protein
MTPTLRAPVLLPGLATGIGSLPHTDAQAAAETVLRCLPELPAVPQLPARDPREGMLAQWLGALPEITVAADGSFDIAGTSELPPECLFDEHAHAGLLAFLDAASALERPPVRVKVQVTGPLTLGVALLRGRGMLIAAVVGNVITSFSWFGVNLLGVGLPAWWLGYLVMLARPGGQPGDVGGPRVPDRDWKSHDLRGRTIRLVKNGIALMRGGYRALLRSPHQKK